MFSQSTIKKIFVAGMALAFILIAAPSANAVVDSNIYGQYQALRARLITKENSLLKDYDDTQKQIDLLHRQNDDRSLTPTINDLSRTLDATYDDLRKTRQTIKDLDLKML